MRVAGAAMLNRVEELRQLAVAKVREGEAEEALALFDEARALATDEEVRELITINKADALIGMERGGPEVAELPRILMRRRNLRHSFLAAYALMYKHRIESENKRGIFYGELALGVAQEAEQPLWQIGALNDLGIIYEIDSQFEKAIASFETALGLIEQVADEGDHRHSYSAALQNLGSARLQAGDISQGLADIHKALPLITAPWALAEAHIDLCYGYLEAGDNVRAREHGVLGLEHASEMRQTRNAHYLLGEAAYKLGDHETAEAHFDELCRFYPQFRNLKSLLFALDLRAMVNLKL